MARGVRDAVADEFGRHAGGELISAVEDLANAADIMAAFLHRAPGALPPDATGELYAALQVFGHRLADALKIRVPIGTLPERGSKP